jgi:hypothetical protein
MESLNILFRLRGRDRRIGGGRPLGAQPRPRRRLLPPARSSGYFYPDFVAELTDGRILVIEYKGEHLEDKQSEQEKRDIGRLWEERSGGRALFLWAVKQDDAGRDVRQQIETKAGQPLQ